MIPIPLRLAVNDDINCYCYIMVTFRVLQNWHKMKELNIEKLMIDAWTRRGASPFADKRLAELFLYLPVMYSLSELAGFKQKRVGKKRVEKEEMPFTLTNQSNRINL